jgi:hypothetical protein
MKPAKLALEPFTEGDRWGGIPNLSIKVNGVAPSSPILAVTMRFKKAGSVPSDVVELSSATPAQITIVNAANWEITVPPQEVPGLTYDEWTWRIRVTAVDGSKQTYLADNIKVLEGV